VEDEDSPAHQDDEVREEVKEEPEDKPEDKPEVVVKTAEEKKAERLGQYLDFMKLIKKLHPDNDSARREANLVWKEKIQKEDQVSTIDYLEQMSILRSKLRQQQFGDSLPDNTGAEFVCVGAQTSVQVAGCFNNWVPQSLSQRTADEWAGTVALPPGSYLYKYVVDGEWLVDPGVRVVTDQHGNQNNQVIVEDRLTACLREIAETRADLETSLSRPWKAVYPGIGLCPK